MLYHKLLLSKDCGATSTPTLAEHKINPRMQNEPHKAAQILLERLTKATGRFKDARAILDASTMDLDTKRLMHSNARGHNVKNPVESLASIATLDNSKLVASGDAIKLAGSYAGSHILKNPDKSLASMATFDTSKLVPNGGGI